MAQRVGILGGHGVFGSRIADQLAQDKNSEIKIIGRDATKGVAFANSIGVEFVQCDTKDITTLSKIIAGASLIINASGPFQVLDYAIPRLCIEQGCHYIDIGDGRKHVAEVKQLHSSAQSKKVFVCVGTSTAPAVTSAAITELGHSFKRIHSIKVALTAGNKNQAGTSTIETILTYAGLPIRVWQEGKWHEMAGWGAGEIVSFPKPVGRRRVQLCDLPDLELFPQLFEATTVTFKAGVELTLFNYAISAIASLRKLNPNLNLPVTNKATKQSVQRIRHA